jgi:dolichyl-phosphate-mannose-protein mannosyltransferase
MKQLTNATQTRYETRTRIVDADGNVQYEGPIEQAPPEFAPPHPDVEGSNPDTKNVVAQEDASKQPPPVEAGSAKDEKSIAEQERKAKPASEANNEATAKEGI